MKRTFLFCVLITLCVCSFAQENRPVSLNEAIQGSIKYLTGRLSPGTKVVVLNFNAPTKSLADYIIDDLNDYIVNSGAFTVVDRRNIETLQQELKFQISGDVSDETAQAIGRMLGAQTIISGSITPLGRNYRFRVQATEVETAAIQGGQTVSVIEDATMSALLGNKNVPLKYARQKFAFGVQAGAMFGLGTTHDGYYFTKDDVYGDWKSDTGNFGFLASLYGAYAFNSFFRLQMGINLNANNGLHQSGDYCGAEYTQDFSFTTLDISLLPYLNLNPSSDIILRIAVGPYISLAVTDIEFTYHFHYDGHKETENLPITNKINFGLLGGIGGGYRIGNGNIVFDLRYLSDFLSTTVSVWGFDSLTRRGISLLLGYEYWF
jgi:hypothetical protein